MVPHSVRTPDPGLWTLDSGLRSLYIHAMPAQFSIDPTPNPNAMKVTVSAALSPGAPVTYNSAAEAEKDAFAKLLFGVAGVRSVFIVNNFATVTKDPGSDWSAIKPKLQDALEQHFQGKRE